MVTVPRGALEELMIRDFASRVHNMDSGALATLMESFRGSKAPDLRAAQAPPSPAGAADLPGTHTGVTRNCQGLPLRTWCA
jgi:hypothetical protein